MGTKLKICMREPELMIGKRGRSLHDPAEYRKSVQILVRDCQKILQKVKIPPESHKNNESL